MDPSKSNEDITLTIEDDNQSIKKWACCGRELPKEEIVFFSQTLIIYIVILCCIGNLTLSNGDINFWHVLMGSCLGYILPNPKLMSNKR